MAFMSRFSRSRSNSPSPSRREAGEGRSSAPSPRRREAAAARERVSTLTVAELERMLYTGKTACNHADQVWPRLYIGDQ